MMTTPAPSAPIALRQQIPAIRVRGGLTFLARQRLLEAGAWVRADGEDELIVGVSVTGYKVMETVI